MYPSRASMIGFISEIVSVKHTHKHFHGRCLLVLNTPLLFEDFSNVLFL